MSMQEHPGSSYVLPAEKLIPILGEKYQEVVEDGDTFAIQEYLESNMPSGYPEVVGVYQPSDEDTVDGDVMVKGEIYLLFEEDDLYVKTPTPELNKLKEAGLEPEFSRYSVWG